MLVYEFPLDFVTKHPEFVASNNSMGFISDTRGSTYNLCHCEPFPPLYQLDAKESDLLRLDWSNFEIADMDFWRGPAYTTFFDYLDATGGFYYEVRGFLCFFEWHTFDSRIPLALGRRPSS
jgi:alpha 1,2-mannosyltransferase